jgi:hypothetical protein
MHETYPNGVSEAVQASAFGPDVLESLKTYQGKNKGYLFLL